MAKQTFTTGQVLTAAQMTSLQQTAMGGGSATAKTASYTLVAADAGTTVIMNSGSATTITVNTALFAAGDTVFIVNQGAGVLTITAGTATVTTAGSLSMAQNETGQLYFLSTSAAIFTEYMQAASSTAFSGCSLYKSATQSVNNDTITTVTFDSEFFDTDAYHSTSSNTSRITIPTGKAGKFLFIAVIQWAANATGVRNMNILKNGVRITEFADDAVSAGVSTTSFTFMLDAADADYFEYTCYQNSGGTRTINATATDGTYFQAIRLG